MGGGGEALNFGHSEIGRNRSVHRSMRESSVAPKRSISARLFCMILHMPAVAWPAVSEVRLHAKPEIHHEANTRVSVLVLFGGLCFLFSSYEAPAVCTAFVSSEAE